MKTIYRGVDIKFKLKFDLTYLPLAAQQRNVLDRIDSYFLKRNKVLVTILYLPTLTLVLQVGISLAKV